MSAFGAAVDEVMARTEAIASFEPGADLATVKAKPDDLVRRMLNGYVELDDTDEAVAFLAEMADATMRAAWQAAGPQSAKAGVAMAGAQMLALGVALGRGEVSDADGS